MSSNPSTQIVGIDLAKRVVQVHVAAADGQQVQRLKLRRDLLDPFLAAMGPSVVAMEACSGAHFWASRAREHGHQPKLLHAKTVARLRQGQKNDANDAATICLAARLPEVMPVPWKGPEQQAVLALHGMRQLCVTMRYSASNQLLGLLLEFGDEPVSASELLKASPEALEGRWEALPACAREALLDAVERVRWLKRQETALDKQIAAWHGTSEASRLLATIPGVGVLTATAYVATVGTAPTIFATARSVAAWLGLVPRQHSTGGITRLGGVGKRGDRYLRCMLFNAATFSILQMYRRQAGPAFTVRLMQAGKHQKVVACALANKLARTAWGMLRSGSPFEERSDWKVVPFTRAS